MAALDRRRNVSTLGRSSQTPSRRCPRDARPFSRSTEPPPHNGRASRPPGSLVDAVPVTRRRAGEMSRRASASLRQFLFLPPLAEADCVEPPVKAYDTAAALAPLRDLGIATALSVQNGVLKNEQLTQ